MFRRRMMVSIALAASLYGFSSCAALAQSPPPAASEWALIDQLESEMVRRLAANNRPARDGAMGRNRRAYISVVFQRAVTWSLIHGLRTFDITITGEALGALEYAFARQNPDGSFQFASPPGMEDKKPNAADLASAAAFFYSELGHGLLLLQDSDWFQKQEETAVLRQRLGKIREHALVSLQWLMLQADILRAYDRTATNRFFFDAMAFYLTGRALNHPDAVKLGEEFLRIALAQQDPKGFFLEKGGGDSSYQAVSILRALILYVHLDPRAAELRESLWKAIESAVRWEAAHIKATGEVDTAGNTRVFPGGEKFFGLEKGVAYVDVALGFYYYAFLAKKDEFRDEADRVLKFYVR